MRRTNAQTKENGRFVPEQRAIGDHLVGNGPTTKCENPKKKTKKWSLSGLFRRQRSKSSDTDSSCETDGRKTGFLSRNSRRRNNGGSRKVVGKFEAIVLPKEDSSGTRMRNDAYVGRPDGVELYDASPNVIKRKRHGARTAVAASASPTRDHQWLQSSRGSGGSLDTAVRRNDKSKIKARAEAIRDRLRDDSSSSDERRQRRRRSSSSSTRNSNCSLPRFLATDSATRTVPGSEFGSPSRKSRVNRRRQSNEAAVAVADRTSAPMPIASPRSRWFARVVYQQSNDYPMRYTARTRSATSSPMSSPLAKPKTFQSCSLPPATRHYPFGVDDGETLMPPSPPPRNPNRKTVAATCAAATARNYAYANRPSSYAFDANARPKEISSFILSSGNNNNNNTNNKDDDDNDEEDEDDDTFVTTARYKSQSQGELRTPSSRRYVYPFSGSRICPKNGSVSYPKPASTPTTVPRLQSNVYINRNLYADEKPNASRNNRSRPAAENNSWYSDSVYRDETSLLKANEIGIPVAADVVAEPALWRYFKSADARPLSAVFESLDKDVAASAIAEPQPRNLEEALIELEEIYNSLKLSDDDLLDRAERRDLQAALKMRLPPNYVDYEDEDDEDVVDARVHSPSRPNRPRLPTSRRSAVPDAVADDMAYRKLRRNDNGGDVKSNPNLVSQSGSFLLMSTTLSPPPLVDVPPMSPPPPSLFAKEPDVTLDDVVFRNIRHTNNTLRVSEPQPPFGIPLSPVPSAAHSDYLHAVPSYKYRSTFNPSRVPDVVKDDLAFRSLRKDFRNETDARTAAPAAASKKRRAVRSLSANVVSLLGQRERRRDQIVDANLALDVLSNDKCASYDHLPGISEDWQRRQSLRPSRCENGDRRESEDDVDETLNLVAEGTRAFGEALNIKLSELEAKTRTVPLTSRNGDGGGGVDGDIFTKRVVVHKPITLSGFKIEHRGENVRNEIAHREAVDSGPQLKLVKRLENISADSNRGNGNGMEHDRDPRRRDNFHAYVEPCPGFNYNGDGVRIVNVEQQQQQRRPMSPKRTDSKYDKTTENSSSGVSSTSNTPDSARKCRIALVDPDGKDNDDNQRQQNRQSDDEVSPSFEQFCRQTSATVECIDQVEATASTAQEAKASPAKKDFCSRFEITLVTPQPAGVDQTRKRWSSVETKDAAIMTEEFGLNGRVDCDNRWKKTSSETAQTRVNRYKEERRKQLASQFNNYSPNSSDTRSSSSAVGNSHGPKNATFRSSNSNVIKDEDAKNSKTPNNSKNTNRIRLGRSQAESIADSKLKTSGSVASDSTVSTCSSRGSRDKSSKRKSYLNRSANAEQTSNTCNIKRLSDYHNLADEGGDSKCRVDTMVASSLPCRVADADSGPTITASASASASPPSASSQNTTSSLFCTVRSTNVLDSWPITSYSARNGYVQHEETVGEDGFKSIDNDTSVVFEPVNKSKIPRKLHSSVSSSPSQTSPNHRTVDEYCDSTFSEFRLKRVEDVALENDTSVRHHSRLNEYRPEKNPIEEEATIESFTTSNDQQHRNMISMSPPSARNASQKRKQKNSLLEIVHNFSDRNAAAAATQQSLPPSTSMPSTPPPPPLSSLNSSLDIIEEDSPSKPSILKKKFDERSNSLDSNRPSSILKRNYIPDGGVGTGTETRIPFATGIGAGGGCSPHTKHGILKKHSSLDEQEVRRRSCSPDVDSALHHECKPILKSQRRRCSLEGFVRNGSPVPELHSILKRSKITKDDCGDRNGVVGGGGSPHGILKRKMFAGSAGIVSSSSSSSCSSSTSASSPPPPSPLPSSQLCGTNDLSDSPTGSCDDTVTVKPILKNYKQHSFEMAAGGVAADRFNSDSPRPILKKKHSVDTDTDDEKPVKPILKSSRSASLDEDDSFAVRGAETLIEHQEVDSNAVPALVSKTTTNYVFENLAIKPILKKKHNPSIDVANGRALLKSTRNVKSDDDVEHADAVIQDIQYEKREQNNVKRHSLPASPKQFCGYFTSRAENGLSVAERIQNLENLRIEDKLFRMDDPWSSKKHYACRNLRFSRNAERYKTQPITFQELFSTESAMEDKQPFDSQQTKNVTDAAKMDELSEKSSDVAEQMEQTYSDIVQAAAERDPLTLDDKAVISNLRRSNSVSIKASLFSKWQTPVPRLNEPVKLKKNEKVAEMRKMKTKYNDMASRFSTQPITLEEVAEAKKQNKKIRDDVENTTRNETLSNVPENDEENDDPSLMSLSERVKLFTQKMEQERITLSKRPVKKLTPRFKTQPVTSEELQIAKVMTCRRNNEANVKTLPDIASIYKKKTSPLSEDALNVSASFEKLRVDSSSAETPSPQDVTISNLVGTDASPNNDIDTLFDKIYLENSSETGSQSEGDTSSSGGREIQLIIGSVKHSSTTPKRDKNAGITKMNIGPIVSANGGAAADVVDDCPAINGNNSIAQRLAALQRSGQLDWKKRISRIVPENELPSITNINETHELLKKELTNGLRCGVGKSPTAVPVEATSTPVQDKKDGSLADRLEKLENASQTWKKRVEPSDAAQFSVAGKMATSAPTSTSTSTSSSSLSLAPCSADSPLSERKKRTPCPSRFRSFREKNSTRSTPISPEKGESATSVLSRSLSLPSDANDSDEANAKENRHRDNEKVVSVPQIFDQDFCTFFGNVGESSFNATADVIEFASDFDDIKIEKPRLISGRSNRVRIQRKHATRGNPLKTLSTRVEIRNEYREIKTNVAEKEMKRMNVEKISKNANLAAEVLAGLASREDFSAVHLKKAGTAINAPLLPYKPLMLLHVKGRRHVQTRLVEPVPESVNSGDCYVLVTANEIYHWIGELCNVIEKSRGAEIAQHILATHDLGCSAASQVHTVIENSGQSNSKAARNFWMLLGATASEAASMKAVASGHCDEDEIYENCLISTNMIFEVIDDELVPYEKYWASIPKIQMLDPNKVFVFDFGSEMYVWMGKNVDLTSRKSCVKLAEELWRNGYNYEECDLCPINSVRTIGRRTDESDDASILSKKSEKRPQWCLLAKVTQHMETVLFREKFLDWPDFSRVIRAKGKDEDTEKQIDGNLDIKPCNVEEMLANKTTEPDLVLEGSHLGRGIRYFDEERRKFCMVKTSDVKMWHITEFESSEMPRISLGQFYSTDSYVVRWTYSISYTGRELNGQPSKHTIVGRERCVYFCWQGKNASLNEQGAAALLTVELDKEKGVQLRICQGYEPPAFFNMFAGRTVVYKNRKADKKWKLFICRGETNTEACLLEVSCNIKQLRSRASFVLLNVDTGIVYVWRGSKVTEAASQACSTIANNLKSECPPEFGAKNNTIVDILHIEEGEEPKEFFAGLGSSSAGTKLYLSLLRDEREYDSSPILYNLSSNTGVFCASPIWSPCRHVQLTTAYPYLQEDLYSASQPALFLVDTGQVLWLWQGWWPERQKILQDEFAPASEEVAQNCDNFRGSATVRWQLERRAAMQTALDYWKFKYSPNEPVRAFLVWAGLEPIQFTNLFPDWQDRDDVAEMNISDGRKPGEVLDVEQELARLTQSTYPVEQLLQRPLPDGVDPTKLELYLSPQHFKGILKVTKEEFSTLPSWKQINLKKNAGLF